MLSWGAHGYSHGNHPSKWWHDPFCFCGADSIYFFSPLDWFPTYPYVRPSITSLDISHSYSSGVPFLLLTTIETTLHTLFWNCAVSGVIICHNWCMLTQLKELVLTYMFSQTSDKGRERAKVFPASIPGGRGTYLSAHPGEQRACARPPWGGI